MNSRCGKVEMGEGWFGRVAGIWTRGQKFMAAWVFLFIMKSMVIRYFFFFQAHTTTCMMLRHLSFSVRNSRCEKVEMGEKWLRKLAGRWIRSNFVCF
jgi:hypothetical protein